MTQRHAIKQRGWLLAQYNLLAKDMCNNKFIEFNYLIRTLPFDGCEDRLSGQQIFTRGEQILPLILRAFFLSFFIFFYSK